MKKTYTIDISKSKSGSNRFYRVKPPECRGSYMQRILEPAGFQDNDSKDWGCQLRWPKDDEEVMAWVTDMKKLFVRIVSDKYGSDEKALQVIQGQNFKIPLRDGDAEDNEEYAGWYFMNVRNKFRQPIILGPHAKALPEDLITDEIIYSGAWYRTRLTFSIYDNIGKGIGAYIDALMKIRDDDRLDAIINVGQAENEFSDFATTDSFDDALPEDEKSADENFDFI